MDTENNVPRVTMPRDAYDALVYGSVGGISPGGRLLKKRKGERSSISSSGRRVQIAPLVTETAPPAETGGLPGSNNRQKGGRGSKAPWKPSDSCVQAISQITALLEGLAPQERGHVVGRIGEMYKPKARTDSKNDGKPSKVTVQAVKQAWKQEWEASPEYQVWANYKGDNVTGKPDGTVTAAVVAEMKRLQEVAFAKREEIKGRHGTETVA